MKKLTKEELQQNADRLMKAHATDKVFATQDGNYFFKQHEAIGHNNELKRLNREWDGEIIPFETAKPEAVSAPVVVEESAEVKDAKNAVAEAEAALKVAAKEYTKADKALGKKPDDETLKQAQATAKEAMETAQLNLDNANTKLAGLQPQV